MKRRCFLGFAVFSLAYRVSCLLDLLKCWLLISEPAFHCNMHTVPTGTPQEHTGVAAT